MLVPPAWRDKTYSRSQFPSRWQGCASGAAQEQGAERRPFGQGGNPGPRPGKESSGGEGSSPQFLLLLLFVVSHGAWLRGPVSGRHVAAGTEWNLDALSARPRISAPQHLLPHPGLGRRGIKRTEARECYANRWLSVLDRSHLFLVKRREKKKKA